MLAAVGRLAGQFAFPQVDDQVQEFERDLADKNGDVIGDLHDVQAKKRTWLVDFLARLADRGMRALVSGLRNRRRHRSQR